MVEMLVLQSAHEESPSSQVTEPIRPRPRVPRSPAQAAQIRKRNRRQEYLERHPTYLASLEHELAGKFINLFVICKFFFGENTRTYPSKLEKSAFYFLLIITWFKILFYMIL